MKKLLVLALVLSLTMLVSASALAAVHNFTGDFDNQFGNSQFSSLSWGGWYSVDKDSPGITGRVILRDDETDLGFEYYQNDQFFVDLSNFSEDGDCFSTLQGSYLFDFGLFVGVDFSLPGEGPSQSFVSPGYRFAFGDNGYAAVSVDYAFDGDFFKSGIIDYDIDFKYFTDNAKIYGQIVIPNEDVVNYYDQTIFELAANYKLNDNYTIGFAYTSMDPFSWYNVGVTGSFDKLLAELRYNCVQDKDFDTDSSVADFNLLYTFADNITAGFQYTKEEALDDPGLYLKFKYAIDDTSDFRLVYRMENDTYDSIVFLRWTKNL